MNGSEEASMDRQGSLHERSHSDTWAHFCLWALLGAAASLGLLTLGSLVVLPVLIGGGLLLRRPALRRSAFGVLSGAGAVSLYVAFVQRRGPGTVCWHTATASGCDQYLNPWPWLVAGTALLLSGVIVYARRRHSAS
jgi:hypothetical protein